MIPNPDSQTIVTEIAGQALISVGTFRTELEIAFVPDVDGTVHHFQRYDAPFPSGTADVFHQVRDQKRGSNAIQDARFAVRDPIGAIQRLKMHRFLGDSALQFPGAIQPKNDDSVSQRLRFPRRVH